MGRQPGSGSGAWRRRAGAGSDRGRLLADPQVPSPMIGARQRNKEHRPMKRIPSAIMKVSGVAVAAMLAEGSAMAGLTVPGPALGAGAPALAVIAGGYWLIRRYRRR
jgi:hypothetical protein